MIWEVKTPRSKLDDTEKLGAELKAMVKRMVAAGIENAEAFGVVAQGIYALRLHCPFLEVYTLNLLIT